MKTTRLLFFLLLTINIHAEGQTAKSQKESDSAKTLNSGTQLLVEMDSIRRLDSLRKSVLEAELLSLKTTDNLKKGELLLELEALKNQAVIKKQQLTAQIDSLRKTTSGFPVVPFEDTLFFVYTRLGAFSPEERARTIENKIQRLGKDRLFVSDSIQIISSEQSTELAYQDLILLSLSDEDALWMGMERPELAQLYIEKIRATISKYKESTSVRSILLDTGRVILVLLILSIIIYFFNRLFRKSKFWILSAHGKQIKGIRIRDYELFTADREVNTLLALNNIVRWLVILIAIYLALPVLFSIFPWTKGIADTLLGYVLNPLKKILLSVWRYLPNLFAIAVIIFIFRYVLRGLTFLRSEVNSGNLKITGFYPEWANPTYQIIRILVFAFMVVVIFPYLPGSDSPVFQGVSVFLGFLFTFGSAGSLSNIIAGLVLTYMRAFRIGDRVKIGDVTGDILEKNLLVTRIRTIKNEDITIPNSNIMSSHTINFSAAAQELGLILHTTVTIGYDVPWRRVHELLIAAAAETPFIMKEQAPFVLQTSLDDFYVSYQINAYTREANKQALIYSNLHQLIQDKFNEGGVEIMSPHYRAMRDGNLSTIPSDYLPESYITPSFRVSNSDNKS